MYDVILVPLDGSKRAEKILPYVRELGLGRNSKVLLLQVIDPVNLMVSPYELVPYYDAKLGEQLVEEAKTYVESVRERLLGEGIETVALVEQGPVVHSILQVAERENVHLIAMASHGRTGLARVFYGSVAVGILHQADRPLLLIRSLELIDDED